MSVYFLLLYKRRFIYFIFIVNTINAGYNDNDDNKYTVIIIINCYNIKYILIIIVNNN